MTKPIDLAQDARSARNASGVAPWLNALDFPCMFRSDAQIYHFFFNPASEKLFRKTFREQHGMECLFSLCEMRKLFMGAKWHDKPPVTSATQLAGTKNRVTNTQLGRIAMQLMELNPLSAPATTPSWKPRWPTVSPPLVRRIGPSTTARSPPSASTTAPPNWDWTTATDPVADG